MPLRPVRALAGAAAVTVTVAGLVVAGTHDGYPVDRPHLLSGSAWVAGLTGTVKDFWVWPGLKVSVPLTAW